MELIFNEVKDIISNIDNSIFILEQTSKWKFYQRYIARKTFENNLEQLLEYKFILEKEFRYPFTYGEYNDYKTLMQRIEKIEKYEIKFHANN